MATEGDERLMSTDDIDEILAAEAGMSVDELREQGDVSFTVPWESEVVADHES